MPRLFTGLEIPDSVKQRLMLIKSGLTGSRWISPENYHLTLRFVGDVENRTADELNHELEKVHCDPFSIRLTGLGSFGGNRPHTLWANVEYGEELLSLQRTHEHIARLIGLPPEARNYTPHVTIARLRGTRLNEVAQFLENFGDFQSEWFEVDHFTLFSSRSNRGGGLYAVEANYPLNQYEYEEYM